MENFWPGSGGFVCDSSDIALSPLVLSDSSSSTGAGCYGTDLAEALSVHLSPGRSAPGSSRESAPNCHRWSFGSLPLSPLACLVGNTIFSAISPT